MIKVRYGSHEKPTAQSAIAAYEFECQDPSRSAMQQDKARAALLTYLSIFPSRLCWEVKQQFGELAPRQPTGCRPSD